MNAKIQKNNLKLVKNELKQLCKAYDLGFRWEIDEFEPLIWVEYIYTMKRRGKKQEYRLLSSLKQDKIAFGQYKPSMVQYNEENRIVKWLGRIE